MNERMIYRKMILKRYINKKTLLRMKRGR